MATKKPITKAKPKTSKTTPTIRTAATTKKSAKTTAIKASKAKKTVTKPATKAVKTPAKAATIKKDRRPSRIRALGTNMLGLRRIHTVTVGVFLLLAILAGVLMSSKNYPLTVGYMAKDQLASDNGTVYAIAAQGIYDIELRWIVVGILVLSSIVPLLYRSRWEKPYSEAVRTTRRVPWRWFDYGVTMGLTLEVVALISGVQDMFVLKLIGGLVFVTCMLGLIAERQNNTGEKFVRSAFYASIFSGVLPWVLIASYAVATVTYGETWAPWYVYASYVATIVGFSLLALNQWKSHRKRGDYIATERNYVLVNLLTKAAFAIILIVAIR